MNERLILELFGSVLVFTIAAIWWSLGQRRRRGDRLSEVAVRLGLSFDYDGSFLLKEPVGELAMFALARQGNGEIFNVLRGNTGGYPVVICDYHYWMGFGDDRSDYTQTVYCFKLSNSSAPDFALRPRMSSFESKIVNASSELWGLPIPPKDSGSLYGVEKTGEWMAVWQRNMTVKPDELPAKLSEALSTCCSFRDRRP